MLITVSFYRKYDRSYQISISTSDGRDYSTIVSIGHWKKYTLFKKNTHSRSIRPVKKKHVGYASPQELGNVIFSLLFNDESLALLRHSEYEQLPIKLNLRFTFSPELSKLPWELIFDSFKNKHLCLSNNFLLSRYIDDESIPRRLFVDDDHLRVLIITSGDVSLAFENEISEIISANSASGFKSCQIKSYVVKDYLGLREVAIEFEPHIVHFIGHGFFDDSTGVFDMAITHDKGSSPDDFWYMLYSHGCLKLVLLNSCGGAVSSEQSLEQGFAQKLLKMGIPAVIAMQDLISDSRAVLFAKFFYLCLFKTLDIGLALSEGRRAIHLDNINRTCEWHIPVLYTRSNDTEIFCRLTSSLVLDEVLSRRIYWLIVESNDLVDVDISSENSLFSLGVPSAEVTILKYLSLNREKLRAIVLDSSFDSISTENKEAVITINYILGDYGKVAELLSNVIKDEIDDFYESSTSTLKKKNSIRKLMKFLALVHFINHDYDSSLAVIEEIMRVWVASPDKSYFGSEMYFHKANAIFCLHLEKPKSYEVLVECRGCYEKSLSYLINKPDDELYLKVSINYSSFLIYQSRLKNLNYQDKCRKLSQSKGVLYTLLGIDISLNNASLINSQILACHIENHNVMLGKGASVEEIRLNLESAIDFIEKVKCEAEGSIFKVHNAATLYMIKAQFQMDYSAFLYLNKASSMIEDYQNNNSIKGDSKYHYYLQFMLSSIYREKASLHKDAQALTDLNKSIKILSALNKKVSEKPFLGEIQYHLGFSIHKYTVNSFSEEDPNYIKGLNKSNYYLMQSLNYHSKDFEEDYYAILSNLIGYNYLLMYESNSGLLDARDKARFFINEAISIIPESSSFLDSLGWLEFLAGNVTYATQLLESSVSKAKTKNDLDESISHLIKLYNQTGNTDKLDSIELLVDKDLVDAVKLND